MRAIVAGLLGIAVLVAAGPVSAGNWNQKEDKWAQWQRRKAEQSKQQDAQRLKQQIARERAEKERLKRDLDHRKWQDKVKYWYRDAKMPQPYEKWGRDPQTRSRQLEFEAWKREKAGRQAAAERLREEAERVKKSRVECSNYGPTCKGSSKSDHYNRYLKFKERWDRRYNPITNPVHG